MYQSNMEVDFVQIHTDRGVYKIYTEKHVKVNYRLKKISSKSSLNKKLEKI